MAALGNLHIANGSARCACLSGGMFACRSITGNVFRASFSGTQPREMSYLPLCFLQFCKAGCCPDWDTLRYKPWHHHSFCSGSHLPQAGRCHQSSGTSNPCYSVIPSFRELLFVYGQDSVSTYWIQFYGIIPSGRTVFYRQTMPCESHFHILAPSLPKTTGAVFIR